MSEPTIVQHNNVVAFTHTFPHPLRSSIALVTSSFRVVAVLVFNAAQLLGGFTTGHLHVLVLFVSILIGLVTAAIRTWEVLRGGVLCATTADVH